MLLYRVQPAGETRHYTFSQVDERRDIDVVIKTLNNNRIIEVRQIMCKAKDEVGLLLYIYQKNRRVMIGSLPLINNNNNKYIYFRRQTVSNFCKDKILSI